MFKILEISGKELKPHFKKIIQIFKEIHAGTGLTHNNPPDWSKVKYKKFIEGFKKIADQHCFTLCITKPNNVPIGLIEAEICELDNKSIFILKNIYINEKYRRKKIATNVIFNICHKSNVFGVYDPIVISENFWNNVFKRGYIHKVFSNLIQIKNTKDGRLGVIANKEDIPAKKTSDGKVTIFLKSPSNFMSNLRND